MIQKAIIEQKIDKYSMRVRIPVYNKIKSDPTATPTDELYVASIQTLPGCSPNYQEGDVVLVDFENDNISYPVIIGLLYRQDMSEGSTDITADSLKVNVNTNLSENTLIGSVTPESIRKLNDKYTNNVKKVVVEYSLSNYQDHYDMFSQWSEQAPQYWPDKYMWQRTTVTYENDTVTRSMTCIQGAKGESGSGTTIEETYVKYAISNNGTIPPSTSALNTWYDNPPQTTDVNPYLWSWTYIRYSDGNVNDSFGVSRLSPNSIILYLYKRSPTVIDRIDWQNSLAYNFDTKQFITLPSGWSAEIPSGNDPIYVTAATATSIQSTDTIAPGEWSTPMLFTKSGFNSKTIQLYKRGASAPSVPSVSVTYTFSDGSISPASPDGWSLAVPTTDGNPCYVIQATAISYENTDTILTSEWSAPTVLARDGNSDYIDEPIVDWYIATATTNPPLTPTTDIETDSEWTSLNWTKNINSIVLSETNKYLWNSEVTHYTITGYVKTNPHIITIYAETGNGIASSTIYYFVDTQGATPPSASAAWSTTFPSSIQEGQYLWTKTVIQYTDSSMVDSILYTVSKDGETGTSISITSTSISYQASTSGTTTPSGTWYSTVSQTGFGDNYPYLWTRTIVNYSSGQSTTAYSVGYKGQDGADGTSVTILGSYNTLQELQQAHPTGSAGDAYMVGSDLYVWSPDTSSWVDVGQIRGDPGQNAYVHFAWATDAQGTGFSLSYFSGAVYCGTYSDDSSTDSTVPSDYVWQRILGENGTSVSITSTSVDYAIGNSSTDHSDSHLYGSTGNKWVSSMRAATDSYPFVWTRTTVNYSDSTTTLSYSVGYKGTDAVTIVSTAVQYQKSNDGLNPPLTWSTDIVAPTQAQPYLWTKTQVVYSDSTLNTTSYSVSKLGADGHNGDPGTDGTSAYVHFAYANSSDGQTDFTVAPVPGVQYLYIGVLSNDTQADSLIYSDYRWSLIKGADGSNGQNTAIVYLYKRSSTAVTIDWTTTLTYSFVDKSLQSVPSGWSQTIPSGSNPLYVTAATASSRTDTDTIPYTEWVSPVVLVKDGQDGVPGTNGTNGTDGLNSATVFLYQRATSSSSITKPTASLTYEFSTGILTGNLGSWSRSIPASNGNPCFVIQATAISSSATDIIAASEWSAITELVVDGQDGVSSVVVLLDNEAHTFAGTTTTAVANSITVNVKGYVGTTLTACNIGTISNVPTGMTVTKNSNNTTSASLTIAVTTSLTIASGSITIPVTCGGVTINKSFSYSIAFKGEDGEDSVLYSLTFSSSVITSESGTLTPASITINAYSSQGASTPSAYSGRFRIQSTTDMSSWTNVYSSSSNQSSYSYSTSSLAATVIAVRVQLYQEGGFTTLLDQQTIPILIKGSNGRGLTSIVEWYALSTTTVRPTTGWTTTFPTMDATNRYLWNYSVITYTDGSTSGSQSDALIIGAYGESVLSLEIQSDNGTLFNSKTTDTTLTAAVYLGVTQLTVNNNGSVSSGGTTVGQLNWFAKERFTGNGVSKTFDLGLDISSYSTTPDIKITINGTVTSAYTVTDQNTITFTTAPSDGSVIVIEYLTSTTGSLYIDRTDVRNQIVVTCKLISDTNTLSISEVTIKDLNDATSLKGWYMLTVDNVEFISEPSVIYDALDYTVVPTGQYQCEQYDSATDQVVTVTENFTWQDSAPIVNDSNVNKLCYSFQMIIFSDRSCSAGMVERNTAFDSAVANYLQALAANESAEQAQNAADQAQNTANDAIDGVHTNAGNIQHVQQTLTAIDGVLSAKLDTVTFTPYQENIDAFMQFDVQNSMMTLGKGNFKQQLSPTKNSFLEGSTEVAYISNQELYINNATINQKLTLDSQWVVTFDSNGLTIKHL